MKIELKNSVDKLDEIVNRLLSKKLVRYDRSIKADVPTTSGLYAIYREETGECLHAGYSSNLYDRLLNQHLTQSANADFVQKVLKNNFASEKNQAREWINTNCFVHWIEVVDANTLNWAEHRMLSVLQPLWGK